MPRVGWRKTDLSVYVTLPDGTRSYVYTMGSGDRRTIAFDAEEAVSAAAATLTDLYDGAETGTGVVEDVSATAEGADVTVTEPPADATYVLAVTFTVADGEQRTRTLFVDVPV